MKNSMTLILATALMGLSGCGDTPEEKAAKEAALKVCPPSEVLSDISSYSTEMAASDLAQPEWLAANGAMDGVVTTESGLQYRVNKAGNEKGPMPAATQTVRVNYHGLLRDGNVFDSSYKRGEDIEFPLNKVIKGWTEGVGLMRPCDAWTFYIPSDLAYGPAGRPPVIPPAAPLVFHVQLIEVSD
ncbi:MAG: FKBP-type peptidyl-prolyl cis-trans isomerase [Acidimicrobiales bacterium]|nr:FKBP-type peptidyl-prolyl cis-trans isomerase [Hyphomonadaceae bacterium]RZV42926.1 MAG: FKBP-type peptidyl-prolyl cis-trans isomerase [Acidimicrobiales bacterium]